MPDKKPTKLVILSGIESTLFLISVDSPPMNTVYYSTHIFIVKSFLAALPELKCGSRRMYTY